MSQYQDFKSFTRSHTLRRVLSTSEFAQAIGISESSARRLADSGSIRIQRTRGGHRKIPVSEAIRYARETRSLIARPDLLGINENETPEDFAATPSLTWAEKLLDALMKGKYFSVIGLLQSMYLNNVTIAEICDGPIRYAMSAIGDIWPQDKRSIFVEHRATILCVRALCQLRLSLPEIEEDAPTAMGAAPQEDPYLLPSLMASLVLHESGFDEVNLGPNTPIDVLTDSAEDEQPNLVWLAITNPIRSRTHHREIEKLADVVKSYGGEFLIGGRNAATFTGADAYYCGSMNEMRSRVASLHR